MSISQQPGFAMKSLFVATLACYAPLVAANPTGGTVVSGGATFNQQGNSLIVTNTPGTVINWQSFSINQDELTRFVQQNANSAVLNRITGQDPSQILGQLQSNGRVFLINPNGIVFGQGAQIDTAGLVASTLNISDDDFRAGKLKFEGAATGNISNAANITTPSGGFVYLIAPNVENSGVIVSPKGEILLSAGRSVELVDGVDTSLRVKVHAPAGQVVNVGQLIAEQGRIGIFAAAIMQQGVVSANRAEVGEGGKIVFKATDALNLAAGSRTEAKGGQVLAQTSAGDTLVSGVVDVSNPAGVGGQATLLGKRVGVFNGATLVADGRDGGGQIRIGGDFQGKNPDVQNAQVTAIAEGATVSANATGNGMGGRLIVWSDLATRVQGNLSARGGQLGGDGGFTEISSKGHLDLRSVVDLSSTHGKVGQLLLDPTDLWIGSAPGVCLPTVCVDGSSGGTLLDNTFSYAEHADHSYISASLINIQGASAMVTLQSNNNITVAEDVESDFGLTLQANNDIEVLSGVSILSDLGSVVLDADHDILVGSGATITTNGGPVDLIAGNGIFHLGTINSSTSVLLQATNDISIASGANITASSGAVTLMGRDVYLGSGGLVDAVGLLKIDASRHITLDGSLDSDSTVELKSLNGTASMTGTATVMAPTVNLHVGTGGFNSGANTRVDTDALFIIAAKGNVTIGGLDGKTTQTEINAAHDGSYNGLTLDITETAGINQGLKVGSVGIGWAGGTVKLNSKFGDITQVAGSHVKAKHLIVTSENASGTGNILLNGSGSVNEIAELSAAVCQGSCSGASSLNVNNNTAMALTNFGANAVTGPNNITIKSVGPLTVNGVVNGGGFVDLVSDGKLTVNSNVTAASGLSLDGGGGIDINALVAGTTSVNLKSGNAAVQAGASGMVSASNLYLQSMGGTGAVGSKSAPLKLTSGGGMSVYIGSGSDTISTIALDMQGSGNLSLFAGGETSSFNIGNLFVSALNNINASAGITGNELALKSSGGSVSLSNYSYNLSGLTLEAGSAGSVAFNGSSVFVNNLNVKAGTFNMSSAPALSIGSATVAADNIIFGGQSLGTSASPLSSLTLSPFQPTGDLSLSAGLAASLFTNNLLLTGNNVNLPTGISLSGRLGTDITGSFNAGAMVSANVVDIKAGAGVSLNGLSATDIIVNSGGGITGLSAITGGLISLTSASSLGSSSAPLGITANNLTLVTTGAGAGIYAASNAGQVTLNAAGDIVYNAQGPASLSATSSGGGINITGAGDLSFSSLTGTGDVLVNSAGALNLASASGGSITLMAAGSIGADGGPVRVNASSLLKATTTGSGSGIYIAEADGVDSAVLTTNNGDISFTSGGAASVTATTGGAGRNVSLTTISGNLTVAGLSDVANKLTLASAGSLITSAGVNLSAADLSLKSVDSFNLGGNLTANTALSLDSGGVITTAAGATISAPTLTLRAVGGIGTEGGSANVNTSNLLASTSGSGAGIYINSVGTSPLNAAVNAGSGNVRLSVAGDMTGSLAGSDVHVQSVGSIGNAGQRLQLASNNLTLLSGGSIFANEADGTTAQLTTTNGDIDFASGGASTVGATVGGSNRSLSLATTSGDLTVSALSGSLAKLSLASGGNLNTPAGVSLEAAELALKSASSFNLGGNLSSSGALTLDSGGSITTASGVSITAPTLTLIAATGIGSSGAAASVNTSNLTAKSGSGGVFINSLGSLASANLGSSSGAIQLKTADATGLLASIDAGSGSVLLNLAGGLSGEVKGGDIELSVASGGVGTSAEALRVAANNLKVTSAGGVFINEKDALNAVVTTTDGAIELTAGGNLTAAGTAGGGKGIKLASLGVIDLAGLLTSGDLTATASGNIVGSGSGNSVSARLASFSAGGMIGPLKTSLQVLQAKAGSSIDVLNATALEVQSATAGSGSVRIESNGGLTTTGPVVAGTSVDLITHSPLTIGAGGVSAGSGITLKSGSGTGNDDITINGILQSTTGGCLVDAGGSVAQNANIVLGGNGAVTVNSQTGNVLMAAGTTTATNGGSIGYTAQGNIALSLLDAGPTGAVAVNATTGAVSSVTPGRINVRGGQLTVNAGGRIDMGVDVPADQLKFNSGVGYAVVRDASGGLVPGSSAPTTDDGAQNDTVNAINSVNTTVNNAGDVKDDAQKKIDEQQSGDQTQTDEEQGDDKNKKTKKC